VDVTLVLPMLSGVVLTERRFDYLPVSTPLREMSGMIGMIGTWGGESRVLGGVLWIFN
jgi:hypothetical protein